MTINAFEIAKSLLFKKHFITASDPIAHEVPRRTASSVLKRLVDEEYAVKLGDWRGSKYMLKQQQQCISNKRSNF